MIRLLKIGWTAAFISALAVLPLSWLATRGAKTVWIINPFPKEQVEINRQLDAPEKGDAAYEKKVIALYGQATSDPEDVLFVPEEKILHPEEMPSLSLLPVDKQKGENPLQVKTVFFFAKWVMRGAALTGLILVVIWIILERRRLAGSKAPGPTPPSSA